MALVVSTDGIVSCASRVVTVVAPLNVLRKGGVFQNLSTGIVLRVRLDDDPTVSIGFELPAGGYFAYAAAAPGGGNQTDFYLGDVRVFNPGIVAVDVFLTETESV